MLRPEFLPHARSRKHFSQPIYLTRVRRAGILAQSNLTPVQLDRSGPRDNVGGAGTSALETLRAIERTTRYDLCSSTLRGTPTIAAEPDVKRPGGPTPMLGHAAFFVGLSDCCPGYANRSRG